MTNTEAPRPSDVLSRRIGQILVQQGFISEEQLEEGLRRQEKLWQASVHQSLGEICVEQGWCEMRHIAEAMRIQQEQMFESTALGQVLIDMGALTLEQLQQALADHQDDSKSFAAFLVERGDCAQQQIDTAIEMRDIRRAAATRHQTFSVYNPFNVMELLVNELLDKVIGEHEGCTCEVCRSNVFSLVLNSLPTRYVSDHSRVLLAAQLGRDEYGSLIRRKITDAVEQVKQKPRPRCRRRRAAKG